MNLVGECEEGLGRIFRASERGVRSFAGDAATGLPGSLGAAHVSAVLDVHRTDCAARGSEARRTAVAGRERWRWCVNADRFPPHTLKSFWGTGAPPERKGEREGGTEAACARRPGAGRGRRGPERVFFYRSAEADFAKAERDLRVTGERRRGEALLSRARRRTMNDPD